MSMSKKDFIALADIMRPLLAENENAPMLSRGEVLDALCAFCRRQSADFMEGRFRAYIAGACGPSGGKIEKKKLRCPECRSTNITPAFGHKLNKCLSCQLAFD